MITETPIILVVDCYSMARSAAAVVKGFQSFKKSTKMVGVVVNKVGGALFSSRNICYA
jgi:cobyrinic acid a,c-diamide synthase